MWELAVNGRVAIAPRERWLWPLLGAAAVALLASLLASAALSRGLRALDGAPGPTAPPRASAADASERALGDLSAAARASISAALGADEPAYRFTQQAGGVFRAADAAQRLRILGDGAGVSVHEQGLELGLSLQATGYGGALRPVGELAPSSAANRLDYAGASVGAWYVNGPLGLEQGFTLARPPAPTAPGPLTLAISLSGNARAALAPNAQSVRFTAADGRALEYAGLSVTDAGGRTLHSWLALAHGRMLVRVDARGARFPVRIDPNLTRAAAVSTTELPQGELTPGPTEEVERAGISVALSADGSTALVGAPAGVGGGAVWVFTREHTKSGIVYTQSEELTAEDAEVAEATGCGENDGEEPDECRFGSALALSASGETALVGAPSANGREGAAFVFTHSGSSWSGVELTSPDATVGGRFGYSVALSDDGELALIGAPGERHGRGVAYMFSGSGMSWAPQGTPLSAQSEASEGHFGKSVALSGNGEVALIGAPDEEEHHGGAWVFDSADGFALGARLTGAGVLPAARYGSGVALSDDGEEALVGAPDQSGAGDVHDAGAAWTFTRSPSGDDAGAQWSEQAPMLTGAGEANEQFGYSVALSPEGDTAVVGAPHAMEDEGEAWLYERSGPAWGRPIQLVSSETSGKGPRFGKSVAACAKGEAVLVGAPGNDRRRGVAWVFGQDPLVKSVSPASGPPQGGTPVTIEGQHFTEATEVLFGSTEAREIHVEGPGLITAVAPPGAHTVPIVVVTPLGKSSEEPSVANEFTYEQPQVSAVKPAMGKAAGGNRVTIEGLYLAGAEKVLFGRSEATIVEDTATSVTVLSPPGTGEVEVKVLTPDGESEADPPKDLFSYLPSGETGGKRGGEEPTSPSPSPSGSSSGGGQSPGGGASGSGQVLALGPVSGAACAAKLLSKTIAVQHGKLAVLKLVGTGSGSCGGKLRLRVRVKLGHRRFELKTIGTGVFSLAAGRRVSVKVTLTRAGRALLRAGHGHLSASLLVVRSSPAPAQAFTAGVRLAPAAKPKQPKT